MRFSGALATPIPKEARYCRHCTRETTVFPGREPCCSICGTPFAEVAEPLTPEEERNL